MLAAVNILGAVVAGLCAVLLLLAHRRVGQRLLLWSGLCFAGLALANALLFVDLSLLRDMTLYRWRLGIAAASMLVLVYGLIVESDRP